MAASFEVRSAVPGRAARTSKTSTRHTHAPVISGRWCIISEPHYECRHNARERAESLGVFVGEALGLGVAASTAVCQPCLFNGNMPPSQQTVVSAEIIGVGGQKLLVS